MHDDDNQLGATLAREFVRLTAGREAAERFDGALQAYGPARAVQEALAGAGLGLFVQRDRRPPDPDAPLVHEGELPDDEPRDGRLLTVDVRHDALEADLVGDVVYLNTPRGVYQWALEEPYDVLEWDTEPGDGVSRLAVLREPHEIDAEIVDVDDEEAE